MRRQHAAKATVNGTEAEEDRARRLTAQNLVALKCIHTRTAERSTRSTKLVYGHVVGIGPYTEMWIVVKDGLIELVNIIGARRIRTGRDSDALRVRTITAIDRELAQDKPVCEMVIEHDWVAIVIHLAPAGQDRPELVDVDRADEPRSGFVVNRIGRIDHFNIVARSNCAIRVGRDAASTTVGLIHSFKGQKRTR